MNRQLLNLLVDPKSKEALVFHDGELYSPNSKQAIAFISGIPSFLPLQNVSKLDRRTTWIYNRLAFAYDASLKFGKHFALASEENVRQQYIRNLTIVANGKILEIGAGTASNRQFLPDNIFYLGLDASFNMLRIAQEKIKKSSLSAEFVHADAHTLPIRSKSFDLVFSMGTLQYLSNPQVAAQEMLRIRKENAEIHIVDEINQYPFLNKGDIDTSLNNLAYDWFPNVNKRTVELIKNSDYFAMQIS